MARHGILPTVAPGTQHSTAQRDTTQRGRKCQRHGQTLSCVALCLLASGTAPRNQFSLPGKQPLPPPCTCSLPPPAPCPPIYLPNTPYHPPPVKPYTLFADTLSASWRPSSTARLKGSDSFLRSALALGGGHRQQQQIQQQQQKQLNQMQTNQSQGYSCMHEHHTQRARCLTHAAASIVGAGHCPDTPPPPALPPQHTHTHPDTPPSPLACCQQLLQDLRQDALGHTALHKAVTTGGALIRLGRQTRRCGGQRGGAWCKCARVCVEWWWWCEV